MNKDVFCTTTSHRTFYSFRMVTWKKTRAKRLKWILPPDSLLQCLFMFTQKVKLLHFQLQTFHLFFFSEYIWWPKQTSDRSNFVFGLHFVNQNEDHIFNDVDYTLQGILESYELWRIQAVFDQIYLTNLQTLNIWMNDVNFTSWNDKRIRSVICQFKK